MHQSRLHALRVLVVGLLVLQMAACASLQNTFSGTTPQTLDEGIAAGYVTLTAANTEFTTLVKSGVLKPEDAQRISKGLDSAGAYLRSSKTLLVNKQLEQAQDYLNLAQDVLRVVSAELSAHQQ